MALDVRRLRSLTARLEFRDFLRITGSHHEDPLGVVPSDSRFCSADWRSGVLYAAEKFDTSFVEAVLRNQFENKARRLLSFEHLSALRLISLTTREDLIVLDLTGDAAVRYGVPNAVIRSADHRSGRAFARRVLESLPEIEAILYPSRFVDGGYCIAVFEKAIRKLSANAGKTLDNDPRTAKALSRLRITLEH